MPKYFFLLKRRFREFGKTESESFGITHSAVYEILISGIMCSQVHISNYPAVSCARIFSPKVALKFTATIILCAVLYLFVSSDVQAAGRLEKEMADLDKIYIAALKVTAVDDKVMSRKVMKALETHWFSFAKKHLHDFADDNSTKVDFAQIHQMIEDAAQITRLNGKLSEVHEILDGVRIIFFHLRQRNSIDYYPDYLMKFNESLEPIAAIARNKTPETLSGGNIATIRRQFDEFAQNWNGVIKAHFDAAIFSFTGDMNAKRKEYIAKETEAITRLQQALGNEDRAAIIREAATISANFNNLYNLFGSTEGIN